jgi:hypothetical protein
MLGKSLALTLGLIVATASVSAQSIRWNAFTTNQNASALGIVTNVVEWAAVFGNPTNVIYVSALRGSLNGERNNPLKPFALLSAANAAALPGDTVLVLDGTFAEQLRTKTGVNYWLNRGVRIAPSTGDVVVAEHLGDVSITGSGTLVFNGQPISGSYFRLSGAARLYVECSTLTNASVEEVLIASDGTTPTNAFLRIRAAKIASYVASYGSYPVEVSAESFILDGAHHGRLWTFSDGTISSLGTLYFDEGTTNLLRNAKVIGDDVNFGSDNRVFLENCDFSQTDGWQSQLNKTNVLGTFYVYQ